MKGAIGGYFELAERGKGIFPHAGSVLLNTGRNAFEYILGGLQDIQELFIPSYTCEVVLEPVRKLGIPYRRYPVDGRLEMREDIDLAAGQYLLVNNYFGIKDAYVRKLAERYGEQLIVDCAQAFFAGPLPGVSSFYSPRKFVGVCDGGIAYSRKPLETDCYERDDSSARSGHLFIRKARGAEAGYDAFRAAEKSLEGQPVKRISAFTEDVLHHIDYAEIITQRRANYAYLHARLGRQNLMDLPAADTFVCPMVYPFLVDNGAELRNKLTARKVFVAKYWPDGGSACPDGDAGTRFVENLLPLPIDQRYRAGDLDRILNIILE